VVSKSAGRALAIVYKVGLKMDILQPLEWAGGTEPRRWWDALFGGITRFNDNPTAQRV